MEFSLQKIARSVDFLADLAGFSMLVILTVLLTWYLVGFPPWRKP